MGDFALQNPCATISSVTAKRLLLVDNQRDVTRILRAALETSGREYVIVDVPSGEEAILEISRGGIDLLVIDLRLPGMAAVDVIKRFKKAAPKAPVIATSGQPDSKAEGEAKSAGAQAVFAKPVRMDEFLQMVENALGLKPIVKSAEEEAHSAQAEPGVADRLASLRRDLGANAVLLVNLDGKVVVRAGDVMRLDIEAMLQHLMVSFSAAMKLCKMLGGFVPTNVHFFDGDDWDVYSANVGMYFALVIIFDGDRGAGQMGPVMRYGRQCADDLLNSLVMMGVAESPAPALAAAPAPAAKPAAAPALAPAPAAPPPPPPKPLSEAEVKALEDAAKKVTSKAAASFWDTLSEETETEAKDVRPDAITFEQAEKLGLVPK